MKSRVDKLDFDKLVFLPGYLSKLRDVVKDFEDIIPDIANLATNTIPNAKRNKVKNQIPSITNLATTAALNVKLNELKNKIPNITNLAITNALTAVENKTTRRSKYILTLEFNNLKTEKIASRLAQANLARTSEMANFLKKTEFDDKLIKLHRDVYSNKTKHPLFENELNEQSRKVEAIPTKEPTINACKILNGAKYCSSGVLKNYLEPLSAKKYSKYFSGTTRIYSCKYLYP